MEALESRELLAVTIGNFTLDGAASDSGSGWSYIGASDGKSGVLTLENYNNGQIVATGQNLQIDLKGFNLIEAENSNSSLHGVKVTGGNLIINGLGETAKLEIYVSSMATQADAAISVDGGVTIQNLNELNIQSFANDEALGITATGNATFTNNDAVTIQVATGMDAVRLTGTASELTFFADGSKTTKDVYSFLGGTVHTGTMSFVDTGKDPDVTITNTGNATIGRQTLPITLNLIEAGRTVDFVADNEASLSYAVAQSAGKTTNILVTANITADAPLYVGKDALGTWTSNTNVTLLSSGALTLARGFKNTASSVVYVGGDGAQSFNNSIVLNLGTAKGMGSATLTLDGGAVWEDVPLAGDDATFFKNVEYQAYTVDVGVQYKFTDGSGTEIQTTAESVSIIEGTGTLQIVKTTDLNGDDHYNTVEYTVVGTGVEGVGTYTITIDLTNGEGDDYAAPYYAVVDPVVGTLIVVGRKNVGLGAKASVLHDSGVINMYAGVAVQNGQNQQGNFDTQNDIAGGVYVAGTGAGLQSVGAVFNLYGGSVRYNESLGGGGVNVQGIMTMEGGEVLGNAVKSRHGVNAGESSDAAAEGGGVRNYQGVVTINGGTIAENCCYGVYQWESETTNAADAKGGGISNSKGAYTYFNGGSIENNICTSFGGAVYAGGNGQGYFSMTGGTMVGNVANQGGAIYMNSSVELTGGTIEKNVVTGGATKPIAVLLYRGSQFVQFHTTTNGSSLNAGTGNTVSPYGNAIFSRSRNADKTRYFPQLVVGDSIVINSNNDVYFFSNQNSNQSAYFVPVYVKSELTATGAIMLLNVNEDAYKVHSETNESGRTGKGGANQVGFRDFAEFAPGLTVQPEKFLTTNEYLTIIPNADGWGVVGENTSKNNVAFNLLGVEGSPDVAFMRVYATDAAGEVDNSTIYLAYDGYATQAYLKYLTEQGRTNIYVAAIRNLGVSRQVVCDFGTKDSPVNITLISETAETRKSRKNGEEVAEQELIYSTTDLGGDYVRLNSDSSSAGYNLWAKATTYEYVSAGDYTYTALQNFASDSAMNSVFFFGANVNFTVNDGSGYLVFDGDSLSATSCPMFAVYGQLTLNEHTTIKNISNDSPEFCEFVASAGAISVYGAKRVYSSSGVETTFNDGEVQTIQNNGCTVKNTTVRATETIEATEKVVYTTTTVFTEGTGVDKLTTTIVSRVVDGALASSTVSTVDANGSAAVSDYTFEATYEDGRTRVQILKKFAETSSEPCDLRVYADLSGASDSARNTLHIVATVLKDGVTYESTHNGCVVTTTTTGTNDDYTTTTIFTEGTGVDKLTTTIVSRVVADVLVSSTATTTNESGSPATSAYLFKTMLTALENNGQIRVRTQILNPVADSGSCDIFYVYTDYSLDSTVARNIVKEARMTYAACPGTVTMNDGVTIENCVGADAGAIAVVNGAVFNMKGGTITDCTGGSAGVWGASETALSGGGAVCVYQSLAYESLGSIVYHDGSAENEADRYQFTANADVKISTLNLSGGIMTDNRGEYGGAIWNEGIVKMTGGSIFGNFSEHVDAATETAGESKITVRVLSHRGNGVYQDGVFELSDSAYIGNPDKSTATEDKNGVYLKTGHIVSIVDEWRGNNHSDPLCVNSETIDAGTTLAVVDYAGSATTPASVCDSVQNAAAIGDVQRLLQQHKIVRLTTDATDKNGLIEGTRAVSEGDAYDRVVITGKAKNDDFEYTQQYVRFLNTLTIGLATLQYGNNSTSTNQLNYILNTGDYVGGDLVSIKTFNETGLSSVDSNLSFVGWNTKADGTGTWIYSGDNNKTIYATGTLFAIWTSTVGLATTTQDDEFDLTWNETDGKWNEDYGTFLSLREAITIAQQRAKDAKAVDATKEIYQNVTFSPNEWEWEHVQYTSTDPIQNVYDEVYDANKNYQDVTTRTAVYSADNAQKTLTVTATSYSNLHKDGETWKISKTVVTTTYTFTEWIITKESGEVTLSLAASLPTIDSAIRISGESFYSALNRVLVVDGAVTSGVSGKSEIGDRYQYEDANNPSMATRSDNAKSGVKVRAITVDMPEGLTVSEKMSGVFAGETTGGSGYVETDGSQMTIHYMNRNDLATWIAVEPTADGSYIVTASYGRTVTDNGNGTWTVQTLQNGENVGLESFVITPSATGLEFDILTTSDADGEPVTIHGVFVSATNATYVTLRLGAVENPLVGTFTQVGVGASFNVQQQDETKVVLTYVDREDSTVEVVVNADKTVSVTGGGAVQQQADGSYTFISANWLEYFSVKRTDGLVTFDITTTDSNGDPVKMTITTDVSETAYKTSASATLSFSWVNPFRMDSLNFENGGGKNSIDPRMNASSDSLLSDGHGGAMFISKTSNVSLAKCEFEFNSAASGKVGGAIANRGTLTAAACVFRNNGGGTITIDPLTTIPTKITGAVTRYGGALYNQGTLLLHDACEFELNGAEAAGGAIYNSGAATIEDGTSLYRNVSAGDGGGIYNYNTDDSTSYLTISDCVLSGNLAYGTHTDDNGGTDGYGGGLMNYAGKGVTIVSTVFGYNRAVRNGGGICNATSGTIAGGNEKPGVISISNTEIRNNSAEYGGGVLNGGAMSIYGSKIHLNTATVNGGGISNTDHTEAKTIDEAKESINVHSGATLLIDDSLTTGAATEIINNVAGMYGGGLSDWGRTCTIEGSTTFYGNTAEYGASLSYAEYSTLPGSLGKNVKVSGAVKQVQWVDKTDLQWKAWDSRPGSIQEIETFVKAGSVNATDTIVVSAANGNALALSMGDSFTMEDLGATETGLYTLTITVYDKRGVVAGERTIDVFVDFDPPIVSVALTQLADGAILNLNLNVEPNDGAPIYQWRVNWGDDSEETVSDSFGYTFDAGHYYAPQATEKTYVVTLEMIQADGSGEGATFILATQTVPAATIDSSVAPKITVLSEAVLEETVETDVADVAAVVAETPLVSFAVLSTDATVQEDVAPLYETGSKAVDAQVPTRRNAAIFRQAFAENRRIADRAFVRSQAFAEEAENDRVDLAETSWNGWSLDDERVDDAVFESIDLDELFVEIDA